MSVFWGRDNNMWEPQGGECKPWRDLKPGDLLAIQRKIWCVREVRDVPVTDWDEHDERCFASQHGCASREEWPRRPLYLIVVPANGGRRRHIKARPYGWMPAYVLSPHYPVCRECGEPWPCRELDIAREVRKEAAEIERLSRIMPGCCWKCGEPVTARQKSIVFEGENLLLPGAQPAVFHLRSGKPYCSSAAINYEKKWVAADPTRHPTLYCTGRLIMHVDGPECSEDPFCPGPGVDHPSFMNHRAYSGYVRNCLRCKDECARLGIVIPGESEAA